MSKLTLGTCMPNLKSLALIILELLTFNTEKFMEAACNRVCRTIAEVLKNP